MWLHLACILLYYPHNCHMHRPPFVDVVAAAAAAAAAAVVFAVCMACVKVFASRVEPLSRVLLRENFVMLPRSAVLGVALSAQNKAFEALKWGLIVRGVLRTSNSSFES